MWAQYRDRIEAMMTNLSEGSAKQQLIKSHHLREVKRLDERGRGFEVVYVPEKPERRTWVYDQPAFTGDSSTDYPTAMQAWHEKQFVDSLGEITEETLREYPDMESWGHWVSKPGSPEAIVIMTKESDSMQEAAE